MLLAAALLIVPALPALDGRGDPVTLEAGPLTVEIHIARTAQLFHVVDQLSAWSPFCHGQYARGMEPLDEADQEMLDLHRAVRGRHGWGGGLEQALYAPFELEEALARAVDAGLLSEEDAALEAEVLEHFAPRVDRLIAADRDRLERFVTDARKNAEAVGGLAARLAELFRTGDLSIECYLIANPADSDFGGGYNGGRLTLEIPREADVMGTFLHEIFHAFLVARQPEIERAIAGVDERLDFQTINEGLAHAISPGIFHADPPESDPLARRLREARRRGQGLPDYEARVYGYAARAEAPGPRGARRGSGRAPGPARARGRRLARLRRAGPRALRVERTTRRSASLQESVRLVVPAQAPQAEGEDAHRLPDRRHPRRALAFQEVAEDLDGLGVSALCVESARHRTPDVRRFRVRRTEHPLGPGRVLTQRALGFFIAVRVETHGAVDPGAP